MRRCLWFLVGATLCCTLSCTEENDIFDQIGTIRLLTVDPQLRIQAVQFTDDRGFVPVQVAEWTVTQADLLVDGITIDLLAGEESCRIVDTVAAFPTATNSACAGGRVLGSFNESLQATLELEVAMSLRRAEPVTLLRNGDNDGDLLINQNDPCPLLANEERDDDICTIIDGFSGQSFLDSDGDGVIDRGDNCVHVENPDQEDTAGVSEEDGVLDLIGDACTEQTAAVEVGGVRGAFRASFDFDLVALTDIQTIVTVDFSNERVLNCNWRQGRCELNLAAVRACGTIGTIAASNGCPEPAS